jgi:hypothetical protein
VIVAAALCPGPPLLAPDLSGTDPAAATLRAACDTAVGALLDAAPDRVVVVGTGASTAAWPASARADLAAYGGVSSGTPTAPLSVGVGALLLDRAGYAGIRDLRTIGLDATAAQCRSLGAELAGSPHADVAQRIGLVVIADGSARRTLKAPGYLDPRAEGYDGEVQRAVADGDLAALTRLDPALANELMAPGWAALQVLAAALDSVPVAATVHYADAPFGVGYLVASLTHG